MKTVGIVSLSSGMLGEDFVKHEYDLGMKRLEEFGVNVKIMKHALRGIAYLDQHPEKRAEDLIEAFKDEEVDMILCAIGGNDTYRLLPYVFEGNALKNVVSQKVFLGFSDTTINHFMLHKLGIYTFYGQSFIADVCELDQDMLPYSKQYFKELLETGKIQAVYPSDVWYEERSDFSEKALNTKRVCHNNQPFELLQGASTFEGKILGGCLESIYDLLVTNRHVDSVNLQKKYGLFPSKQEWQGKILLLETSEEKPSVEHFKTMLEALKQTGIFDVISGVLVGKPMDELHYEEYKEVLKEVIHNPKLSILYNINIGHATPRCIIPFGVHAKVDALKQVITFHYE